MRNTAAEKKDIKIMLKNKCEQELREVTSFIESLTPNERKEFLIFVRGIGFARDLKREE